MPKEQDDIMDQPTAPQQRPPLQEGTQQQTTPQQRPPLMDESVVPPMDREGPPPVFDIEYIPGYLLSNIGKNVRAEFVIGNSYVDKVGRLIEVGVNYFVLDDVNSKTHIMCDLYSVKFVTVIV
jgi:hypothetical protein